jgi:hypothetical protein
MHRLVSPAVTPAKAGVQVNSAMQAVWVPAFAGMTVGAGS